jgi:preprotein translocase subunit SecY
MGVVLVTTATRRITVQYARQVVGNKVYGGQRQYIPLKLNSAGVMPIIFAQSLMFLPAMVSSAWVQKSEVAAYVNRTFQDNFSWQYNLALVILIILFTYFYTAISINPVQIAEDMKKNNSFIPGVKPGIDTSNYIDDVLTKITLPGALFLCAIAILPAFAKMAGIGNEFAQFYGGTSLLIMVGVILDTLQQVESYLLMKHYEGMMYSGSLKSKAATVYA